MFGSARPPPRSHPPPTTSPADTTASATAAAASVAAPSAKWRLSASDARSSLRTHRRRSRRSAAAASPPSSAAAARRDATGNGTDMLTETSHELVRGDVSKACEARCRHGRRGALARRRQTDGVKDGERAPQRERGAVCKAGSPVGGLAVDAGDGRREAPVDGPGNGGGGGSLARGGGRRFGGNPRRGARVGGRRRDRDPVIWRRGGGGVGQPRAGIATRAAASALAARAPPPAAARTRRRQSQIWGDVMSPTRAFLCPTANAGTDRQPGDFLNQASCHVSHQSPTLTCKRA